MRVQSTRTTGASLYNLFQVNQTKYLYVSFNIDFIFHKMSSDFFHHSNEQRWKYTFFSRGPAALNLHPLHPSDKPNLLRLAYARDPELEDIDHVWSYLDGIHSRSRRKKDLWFAYLVDDRYSDLTVVVHFLLLRKE